MAPTRWPSPTSARVSDSASAGSPRRFSSIRTRCPRPRTRPSLTASSRRSWTSMPRARHAEAAAAPLDVFVKIDVGLERLGVPAEQAVKTIVAMLEMPHLRLAGICAHPHAHGADPAYADWQLGRFTADRRRAGIARHPRAGPAVRRLAVRAAGPADVSQRRRSRPDPLRHHLPRRDVAGPAAARRSARWPRGSSPSRS